MGRRRAGGYAALTIIDHLVRSDALLVVVEDLAQRVANLGHDGLARRLELGQVVGLLDEGVARVPILKSGTLKSVTVPLSGAMVALRAETASSRLLESKPPRGSETTAYLVDMAAAVALGREAEQAAEKGDEAGLAWLCNCSGRFFCHEADGDVVEVRRLLVAGVRSRYVHCTGEVGGVGAAQLPPPSGSHLSAAAPMAYLGTPRGSGRWTGP